MPEPRPMRSPEGIADAVTRCLAAMLDADPDLYEQILDTPGFAYHFSQLCILAKGNTELAAAASALPRRKPPRR